MCAREVNVEKDLSCKKMFKFYTLFIHFKMHTAYFIDEQLKDQ